MLGLRYEGLREMAQALRIVNAELYAALVAGLDKAGDVVRADASSRFEAWAGGRDGADKAAEGFRVLVRPTTSTMAIVSVGQTLRSSADVPRRRPNWGGLQMTEGLLPAQRAKLADVAVILDGEVAGLLHEHGF